MWVSDFSVNQSGDIWSELLYSVRGNTDLTNEERAALLGGTAWNWLDWQAPRDFSNSDGWEKHRT